MAQNIDPVKIHDSIEALNKFITDNSVTHLISALEALAEEPDSKVLLAKVSTALITLDFIKDRF